MRTRGSRLLATCLTANSPNLGRLSDVTAISKAATRVQGRRRCAHRSGRSGIYRLLTSLHAQILSCRINHLSSHLTHAF